MIGGGYLKFDNSAFTKAPDGRTTFWTRDVYAKTVEGHLTWKGRKEDYIQVGYFKSHVFLYGSFFFSSWFQEKHWILDPLRKH